MHRGSPQLIGNTVCPQSFSSSILSTLSFSIWTKAHHLEWGYRLMNVARKKQGMDPRSIWSVFSPLFLLGGGTSSSPRPTPPIQKASYSWVARLEYKIWEIIAITFYQIPAVYQKHAACVAAALWDLMVWILCLTWWELEETEFSEEMIAQRSNSAILFLFGNPSQFQRTQRNMPQYNDFFFYKHKRAVSSQSHLRRIN